MLDAWSQPTIGYTLILPEQVNRLYIDLYPNSDPLKDLLEDEGSLALDARSHPIMGYILMAARVGQSPIWVFTLTVTLMGAS